MLGSSISDTATLSGVKGSPAPVPDKSKVTFNVYAASDTSCTTPLNKATIQTASTGGSGVNPTYTSGTFTPTTAGSYQWVASFAGDSNNNAVSGACGDPTELSVVNKATPSITTTLVLRARSRSARRFTTRRRSPARRRPQAAASRTTTTRPRPPAPLTRSTRAGHRPARSPSRTASSRPRTTSRSRARPPSTGRPYTRATRATSAPSAPAAASR